MMMLTAALRLSAQYPAQDPVQPEKWNLHLQATSIGQYHGGFNSPYANVFNLQGHPEAEASLTSTLFYFDPELACGGSPSASPRRWVSWRPRHSRRELAAMCNVHWPR